MAKRFERVLIAGVGLIGGSFGAAIKEAGLAGEVVGYGRTRGNLEVALGRGLIDRYELDVATAARGADLLLLAVPVQAMAAVVAAAAPGLAPGAIITDAGSVKAAVVNAIEQVVPAGVSFVGAHPIAGSEEMGAAAARADLFRDHECIVTPGRSASAAAVDTICELWAALGMRVTRMDPEQHDRVLAWVSHLPHAIAFALARAITAADPSYAAHGGNSFAEMTRIAASSAELWRDVFRSNEHAVVAALDGFLAALHDLREQIAGGDDEALTRWIEQARTAKQSWPDESE